MSIPEEERNIDLEKEWNEKVTETDRRYFKCNNCDAEFDKPIEELGQSRCPTCLSQNIKKVIERRK